VGWVTIRCELLRSIIPASVCHVASRGLLWGQIVYDGDPDPPAVRRRGFDAASAKLLRPLVTTTHAHPRLQAVQNAAARLVTGIRWCEQLYWMPVRQRIEFKIALLVYKSLNALSPRYLMDDCQLITTTGRRRLLSSNVATCDIPRTRTSLGDRSFTAAGPRLWNNLPVHLRDSELTLFEFRRLLKTHLFGWRPRRLVTDF